MTRTILLSLIIALTLRSQTLSITFTGYSDGVSLDGQDGWTANVASSSTAVPGTASPLTYSGYGGGGAYLSLVPNASVVTFDRDFAASKAIAFPSTFYYSMLVNVSSSNTLGRNCFFLDASGGFARLWIRDDGAGKWNVGVSKNNLSLVWGTASYNYGQTYLVMVRYDFVSGSANDEARVWVNPALTGEPTPGSADAVSGAGQSEYESLTSCTGVTYYVWSETPTWRTDDLRVGYGSDGAGAFADLNYDGTLPAVLSSFTAGSNGRGIVLRWSTASETDCRGFDIERQALNHPIVASLHPVTDPPERLWTTIGFVEGRGTAHAPYTYSFVDAAPGGPAVYRLKQWDRDGSFSYSNTVEVRGRTASVFALGQNSPNPFNPSTVIPYRLPAAAHTSLRVFDLLGKEVATLVNGMQNAGTQTASFDASHLPSGIYFARLSSGSFNSVIKMTLMK